MNDDFSEDSRIQQPSGAADGGPYPDPRRAFLLTIGAFFASGLVGVFFIGLGPIVAVGIGQAIAVGLIATLAAKRIPEPQADRIGLRGFDLHALPLVLCLVPAILLASELDNVASDWSSSPIEAADTSGADFGQGAEIGPRTETQAETKSTETRDDHPALAPTSSDSSHASAQDAMESGADGIARTAAEEEALALLKVDLSDPWTIAQAFVISVGITPIVEEFFFRGVLQQSLVARLGLVRGVGFVALLYTLPHLPVAATFVRFSAGLISAFGMGCLLGLVRLATGSILASIVLASLSAAVGIFSFAVRDRLRLPGMNVDGTHLPISVTFASLIIVGWAAHSVYQEARRRFEAEHRPG